MGLPLAFNFNMHRYSTGHGRATSPPPPPPPRQRRCRLKLVDSKSKAPGTKHLKLKYDKPLSIFLQFCFQSRVALLHDGRDGRDPPHLHSRYGRFKFAP